MKAVKPSAPGTGTPGARCDADAYIYCFTSDKQLMQEWERTLSGVALVS